MDNNPLYLQFNLIHPITEAAWKDFEKLLEPKKVARNEYTIRKGDPVKHGYLLLEGVMRVFYNKDGNEYNKTFFIPGMFPSPLTALLTNTPSDLYFQALTDCKLMRFPYVPFTELFEKHRCLESLMRRILEIIWIKKERHDINMVTNDATTNYMIFQKDYPELENLIPQYHIASYLGITPIQLSRIRAQLAKG